MVQAKVQSRTRTKWLIAGCVLAVILAIVWFVRRPTRVQITNPKLVSLTETIASSARVGGVQESAVGAQFTGTVQQLFVRIGDRVKAGQVIAVLRNEVPQQQKAQAQTAVTTARAKLAQVSKPPLQSELNEAAHGVNEAKAQVSQINAQLQLATKDYERAQQMYSQGLIPRSDFDRQQSNQQSLRSQLNSAKATVRVREAKQETLQKTPLPEDVQVARAQLAEAEQALQVADQQSREAKVLAPFDGVVTALNAEQGQTVGTNGVVNLVSDDLEIRVDLDETNLADLELGQTAILSSSAFGGKTFEGKLTDIGAAVDEARGIVTIKITPENPPDWLRPGQTVNVNLVTNDKIDRYIVPSTAVIRQGSRTLVMAVDDGHVIERPVMTRPAMEQGIPIASGVVEADDVIVNPSGLKAGQAVRVRR
ncbi:MAG TPA: efflux RND transporter periplasmic adaptor subunit [Edaphobacter sp.]